jgi:hypothetical protein
MGIGGREIEGIRELPEAIHRYIRFARDTAQKPTLASRAKLKKENEEV